jgi:choline dehydrogenase-like flavoprotein
VTAIEPIVHGREATKDLDLDCDVVVVGSGAAGAVVATELALAGQKVVILEEGPHVPGEEYGRMRPSESIRHVWRDGAMTFAIGVGDSPTVNVTMGRVLGGSSMVTGGVCFRTPEPVLDEWTRAHQIPDVKPADMEPCFEAVERAIHVEEVPVAMRSRSTHLFAEGARRVGFEMKPMKRNTKDCHGCGRCNFGCPEGAKLSVDLSYIPRARAAGARVVTDCLVSRVLTKGGRAVGVEGRLLDGPRAKAHRKIRVRARRVAIACGAYHSPMLLQSSGVGRASGQVGKNMTLHPSFRVMARFDELVHGWSGALQSAWSDHLEKDKITLTGLFIPPAVVAATLPGIGPAQAKNARAVPRIALFGGLIHDDGAGTVRRGLGREPLATYRMSKSDRAAIPVLMRRMAEIFFAAGAREVYLPILGNAPITPDSLRTLDLDHVPAVRIECASQHPLGTCRMGVSEKTSVVDAWGETWDVKDLYVVDGGVLPTSLGVNPQLSVMAMATRLAWRMREKPLA